MTTLTAEQQFLMGGESVPSAFSKNDPIGTRRGGKIVEQPELRQQTDFDSGALLTWDDGSPRMHLVITVQTEQRDPSLPDDDGRRRFYVKANLQKAVREAIRKAGAPGLEVGGSLFVTRSGQDEPKRRGLSGAWLHTAEYVPAAQAFVADPAPATPAPAASSLPYPPHLTPEQLAGLQAANVSPEVAWQMFPAPAVA